jgi:hypothetical protein
VDRTTNASRGLAPGILLIIIMALILALIIFSVMMVQTTFLDQSGNLFGSKIHEIKTP